MIKVFQVQIVLTTNNRFATEDSVREAINNTLSADGYNQSTQVFARVSEVVRDGEQEEEINGDS